MPIFLSEEEFQSCSHDLSLVVEKADAFIKEILNQLETVKAEADASSITAEQTCSLLEQKYVSLSSEFSSLQSRHSQLNSSLDERVSEVAQLQSQKHEIQLLSVITLCCFLLLTLLRRVTFFSFGPSAELADFLLSIFFLLNFAFRGKKDWKRRGD